MQVSPEQAVIANVDAIAAVDNHYLVKAKALGSVYFSEFLIASARIGSVIPAGEFAFWCKEKMLLKNTQFEEKTFIQYAVESSAAAFFANRYPESFQTEVKVTPGSDKDVDCRFSDDRFTYNVEVKCSDFKSKEKIDALDAIKYGTAGRIPDRQDTIDVMAKALDEGFAAKGEPLKQHIAMKNMDNNLKDFLELAHGKFNPAATEDEVNILLVGCDDAHDVESWHRYLFAEQGLFTNGSFANPANYNNVDAVILTNLYYKHNQFFSKRVKNSWSLENTFNLVFANPFRRAPKEAGIKYFLSQFPHYTDELFAYEVPGNAEQFVKNMVRISWFIKDFLEKEKGIFLFSEPDAE